MSREFILNFTIYNFGTKQKSMAHEARTKHSIIGTHRRSNKLCSIGFSFRNLSIQYTAAGRLYSYRYELLSWYSGGDVGFSDGRSAAWKTEKSPKMIESFASVRPR